MGSERSKPARPVSKIDLEITAEKVVQHLTLARDRKINELASKERELKDRLKRKMLPYEDLCFELITIVNLFKYVKAAKIVIRYSQLLKEHSAHIVDACQRGNLKALTDLTPYFSGVVWSADRLNLSYVKEFSAFFHVHFGPEVYDALRESQFVDEELRQCFGSIEPSLAEINDYLRGFADRYKIEIPWPPEAGGGASQGGQFTLPPLTQTVFAPPHPSPSPDAAEQPRSQPRIVLQPVEPAAPEEMRRRPTSPAPRVDSSPTLFNRREATPKRAAPENDGAARVEQPQNIKDRLFAAGESNFIAASASRARPSPEEQLPSRGAAEQPPFRAEQFSFEMRIRTLREGRV